MDDDKKYFCPECAKEYTKNDSRLGSELFCPICKSRLESITLSQTDLSSDTKASSNDDINQNAPVQEPKAIWFGLLIEVLILSIVLLAHFTFNSSDFYRSFKPSCRIVKDTHSGEMIPIPSSFVVNVERSLQPIASMFDWSSNHKDLLRYPGEGLFNLAVNDNIFTMGGWVEGQYAYKILSPSQACAQRYFNALALLEGFGWALIFLLGITLSMGFAAIYKKFFDIPFYIFIIVTSAIIGIVISLIFTNEFLTVLIGLVPIACAIILVFPLMNLAKKDKDKKFIYIIHIILATIVGGFVLMIWFNCFLNTLFGLIPLLCVIMLVFVIMDLAKKDKVDKRLTYINRIILAAIIGCLVLSIGYKDDLSKVYFMTLFGLIPISCIILIIFFVRKIILYKKPMNTHNLPASL